MAIAAQDQLTPEAPEPRRSVRPQSITWPKPSQLRRSVPILRLLAEIWSVPEVAKIGLHADESGVQVRVLMGDNQRAARGRIYAAERDYLNATRPHGFNLRVIPMAKAGPNMPPPFETVLER